MPAYATTADLARLTIPAEALADITAADQDAALAAASTLADGYLASRFTLPLSVWGDDLRLAVCSIGAYRLMTRRGYNPVGGDENLRLIYEDAMKWLKEVANGLITPLVTDSSTTPTEGRLAGEVRTSSKRGW